MMVASQWGLCSVGFIHCACDVGLQFTSILSICIRNQRLSKLIAITTNIWVTTYYATNSHLRSKVFLVLALTTG